MSNLPDLSTHNALPCPFPPFIYVLIRTSPPVGALLRLTPLDCNRAFSPSQNMCFVCSGPDHVALMTQFLVTIFMTYFTISLLEPPKSVYKLLELGAVWGGAGVVCLLLVWAFTLECPKAMPLKLINRGSC